MIKKYISIAMVSAAVFGLASCDMDAPSKSSMDAETVYSMPELAEPAVMAILDGFGTNNSYRNRIMRYGAINTDIEWLNSPSYNSQETGKYDASQYDTEPSNDQLRDGVFWSSMYDGIDKANMAIKYLTEYGHNSDAAKQAQLDQLLGEAYTLRAVLYMELMKFYGDVPARWEEMNSSNTYLPRSSRDDIMIQLLADLKKSEDLVAWPNATEVTMSTQRVNKAFVKGLRARIALYACGYALRNDNGKPSYSKSTNAELAEDKMLPIVKEECLDIIKNYPTKLANLPFVQNFENLCKDVTLAGLESLWEIPFPVGRGQLLYAYAPKHNGTDTWCTASGANYGGQNGPIPTLYYDYDSLDVRRDITCVPYGFEKGVPTPAKVQAMYFGKVRYDWMARTVDSQDDGVNFQYMRLADIYLMLAEAINTLDNDQATAWTYLKPVLARVLPTTKVNALQEKYCVNQKAFQDGIIEQRGFEFAGEMIRKFDLIRWGNIDEKMAEAKTKLRLLPYYDEATGTEVYPEGPYKHLPAKIYYKVDGNSMKIYGMERYNTDEVGKDLVDSQGYTSKGWFWSTSSTDGKTTTQITDDMIKGIYCVEKPSLHCVWPIPSTIISNDVSGQLNNDFLGK